MQEPKAMMNCPSAVLCTKLRNKNKMKVWKTPDVLLDKSHVREFLRILFQKHTQKKEGFEIPKFRDKFR